MFDITGLDTNPKLGYYKVGDQKFCLKSQAFMYATKHNLNTEWKFNIESWGQTDWTQEPETDVRELYRLRAQQLRDRYDYIFINCSGGSDSTTALYSFILNGIHLDEVVFRYPKTGEQGVTDDPFNTKSENTLSEYKYAVLPLLNWVKTHSPQTRITVHDFAETMLEKEKKLDESWVFETRHWFQPAHTERYDNFSLKHHKELLDSGKSICALHGIDKPRVSVIDNKWYCFFTDMHVGHSPPRVNNHTNLFNEFFYWTPDFPEIVVKQSHMIRRWFDLPTNHHLRSVVDFNNQRSVARRTAYEQIVKTIIYPDYDPTTFQTEKPTNSFYNEMDTWFYTNFQETRLYDIWQGGLQLLLDNIDPKYFDYQMGQPTGLVAMHSPLYYLGDSTAVQQQPVFVNRDYHKQMSGEIFAVERQKLRKVKF